jgi:integrase
MASVRSVYEHPPDSGIWWVNYYVDGKRHREKVGRKKAAIDLYQKRKTDAREGKKLPNLRNSKALLFDELIDDALEVTAEHRHPRDYTSKAAFAREALGQRPAAEITPQEIDRWLTARKKSPATSNRYRDFLSICFREGMRNGKVNANPARLVRKRKEPAGRLRFLSRSEYAKLAEVVQRDQPDQFPALVVSVYTGMRWSEQFGITWSQVDLALKKIHLTRTKNGSDRTVPLNSVAVAALEQQKRGKKVRPTDRVFPLPGPFADHRWWFNPALKESKIDNYSWHGNRHTFCSWSAMAGISIKEIQVLAGHKSIAMSARYSHLSPEHPMSATERLVSRTAIK